MNDKAKSDEREKAMTPDSATIRRVPTGPARRGPSGAEPARVTAGQPGTDRGDVVIRGEEAHIDARGVYYKTLNEQIREQVRAGYKRVVLDNVNGQRYIGGGLSGDDVTLVVNGVPGNDMATFMSGPTVVVNENAQDGVANTMNSGLILINGDAGDVLGYGMRGGRLYIRGDVGYRVGIHMKAYGDLRPVMVIGGRARDFFGEYMAGGELILLALDEGDAPIVGSYVGTGMHGGVMYIRGNVADHQLGKEVTVAPLSGSDETRVEELVRDFADKMELDADEILSVPFIKIYPYTHRPYGKLYAY